MSNASTPPPSPSEESVPPQPIGPVEITIPPAHNRWYAGTLVYGVAGILTLFFWLLWGDFALSMRERSVGTLVEKFLLNNGSNNVLKQLLTSTLPTMIGLILGPAISYMSDRHRGPWGRRIPFLIIPTPIAGLAMVGIAFSPQIGQWLYHSSGHTPAEGVPLAVAASKYTISIFTVFWTIFEVAVITSASVMGGLINDVVPRPLLGRFHGLFRAVSLYDGIIFNMLLLPHAEQHFTTMFAYIGVLFGGGFLLMCLKVREGDYPPPPVEVVEYSDTPAGKRCTIGGFVVGAILSIAGVGIFLSGLDQKFVPFVTANWQVILMSIVVPTIVCTIIGSFVGAAVDRRGSGGFLWWLLAFVYRFFGLAIGYLRECFKQPYYLMCFALLCIGALTFKPINDFAYRYAMQLKMQDSDFGFINGSGYVVSLVLAFPLGMFVDKFHAIRMAFVAMLLYILTTIYGSFYARDAVTYGIALIAHTVLSGTYYTCVASLAQQLLPRSKFTQYASAGGIVASIVTLIYAPAIGAVLDRTKHDVLIDNKLESNINYHLTFWVALVFGLVTIALMILVYRRFMAYGGPQGYIAPGDTGIKVTAHEPPTHMVQILSLYFVGAAVGAIAGYLLSYGILAFLHSHNWLELPTLTLGNLHELMTSNKWVRNITTFGVATGLLPFLILGGWAGTYWAKRRQPAK